MELISFLSVFLPLLTGPQPVELAVADSVARVEIRLDGEQVAELSEPPWIVSCDLGEALLPHRLEAVAFDGDGSELDRAERWLNLTERVASVSLAIKPADDGGQLVDVSWDHAEGLKPARVSVTMDGEPLKLDGGWRLPELTDEGLHLVRAELTFPGRETFSHEILVGRALEGSSTELSAVAVEADSELPEPSAMKGWFTAGGEPLEVVSVEKPEAEIVVVFDEAVDDPWFKMTSRERRHGGAASSGGWSSTSGVTSDIRRSRATEERAVNDLPDGVNLRILSALPAGGEEGTVERSVFEPSRVYPAPRGEVLLRLPDVRPKVKTDSAQTVADAVAVAGRMAATGSPRRAVLLIVTRDLEDASTYTPEQVEGYLEALQVPLEVWTPEKRKVKDTGWGKVERVSNMRQLDAALRTLEKRLGNQRIVWVRGAHLPQEIELAGSASGVRLAGARD